MRGLVRTWSGAWQEAWVNRRSFWVQITIMLVNNVVWVGFWVLFFQELGTVRGWDVDLVLLLLAVLTTAAGLVMGLLSNARRIDSLAAEGGLDASLALPVSTLGHVLTRKVEPTNVGDLLFGVLLFAVLGDPTPQRAAAFVFGVICATCILLGFLVLVGSLSFFVGRNEAGELGFHAILLFSAYPVDIFSGTTRLFLYAVVPAGFVSNVPARLIDEFELLTAAGVATVALLFLSAGVTAFNIGMRRYTSGAVWTDA